MWDLDHLRTMPHSSFSSPSRPVRSCSGTPLSRPASSLGRPPSLASAWSDDFAPVIQRADAPRKSRSVNLRRCWYRESAVRERGEGGSWLLKTALDNPTFVSCRFIAAVENRLRNESRSDARVDTTTAQTSICNASALQRDPDISLGSLGDQSVPHSRPQSAHFLQRRSAMSREVRR